ncbi:MAG TPA: glycosyltransferase 87 family protein [Nitriliruptorales bacterium]|nr:glycosyltransferase 87 family protein [Nitriliruptorales bacterium]
MPARPRPTTATVAALLLLVVGLATAIKLPCAGDRGGHGGGIGGFLRERSWCYSDVAALYDDRGFDQDVLPYDLLDGRDGHAFVDRGRAQPFEYPPGIAVGGWLVALVTASERGFLIVTAGTLAAAAVITLWQLAVAARSLGVARQRLLLFAASPTLLALGVQNWDLWAVAPAVAGVAAAARQRPLPAAGWLGIAAAVKWWPALLVPVVLVGPWAPRPARRWGAGAVFAGTWIAAQIPALLVAPSGWWASIVFHLEREPNRASPLGVLQHVGEAVAPSPVWSEVVVPAGALAGAGVLLGVVVTVARRLGRGTLGPADAAFVLVGTFLVVNKVVSVQFVLWLLPLAVLAHVPWWAVVAVDGANAAVWLLWAPVGDDLSGQFWTSLALAVARSGLLAWTLVAALRGRWSTRRGTGPSPPVTRDEVAGTVPA